MREAHTTTQRRIAQAIGAIAILVISCEVSTVLPPGAAFPSPAPGEFETIVAGTAGAAQTQTAVLVPATFTLTFTPTVTRTPTATPTATRTFVWVMRSLTPIRVATLTPTLGPTEGKYSCRLIDQDPDDNSRIAPGKDFDAVWEVRNTGSAAWSDGDVDFVYVGGRKMHEQALYDLDHSVNPGDTINLVVDMKAPKDPATYKLEWALRRGGNEFCHVNMTIVVR